MSSSLLFMLCALFVSKGSNGFTVDLIHRDSPLSPFYEPSKSNSERFINAVRRSINRINHFKLADGGGAESVITSASGEFLMNISVGTPPVQVMGIADTGSDLIWTQCEPCKDCYKQIAPIFDPKESSTYRNLACETTLCTSLKKSGCDVDRSCTYNYGYGDKSYTRGNLASETVGLGPVSLPKVSFGCGHENGGTFGQVGSGIIGLGGGPFSLVRQLGSVASGKFSYCLVSPDETNKTTSKIGFGPDGVVSGDGVVTTPLVAKSPDTYYYLTLEAMSVGSKKLPFKTNKNSNDPDSEEGNIIIDSGTTLTFLPTELFNDLVAELAATIDGKRSEDPSGTFSLCYTTSDDLELPKITAHFKGADVVLEHFKTFFLVGEGLVCLAMASTDDVAIYGNLSQMDFLIGYDIEARTVSFKPTVCTKL